MQCMNQLYLLLRVRAPSTSHSLHTGRMHHPCLGSPYSCAACTRACACALVAGPDSHGWSHQQPHRGAVNSLAAITEAASKSVLTVGSGDGSQQAAAARAGVKHLTCTFMDSEQEARARAHSCLALHWSVGPACSQPCCSDCGMLPHACRFAASTATRAQTSTTSRATRWGCRCSSPWMPHSSGQAAGRLVPAATRGSTSSAGTSRTRVPPGRPKRRASRGGI
jgi:hypothetical protein